MLYLAWIPALVGGLRLAFYTQVLVITLNFTAQLVKTHLVGSQTREATCFRGVSVYEIAAGLIQRETTYLDLATLLVELEVEV